MALLFVITVLSLTGILVDSASNVTDCDAPLSNTTCTQGSCAQPPCTMQCGLSTPYEQCEQKCDANKCDSMKCDASDRCTQGCRGGECTSMTCDAQSCFQTCDGSICGVMTCAKNAKSNTTCDQSSVLSQIVSVLTQMICERDTCTQNCNGGNCTMTCSSDVKQCTQNCIWGLCRYKCEAKKCTINCQGGACIDIKPSSMPPTTIPSTTITASTTTSSDDRLQMTASVGFTLIFVVVAFM